MSPVLLCALACACRTNERAPAVDVDASAPSRAPAPSATVAAPSSAALDASAPAQPAPFADPSAPDVRVEIPFSTKSGASMKAEVAVGQTFGVLLPNPEPEDWMDTWELAACPLEETKAKRCPLGTPLRIASREPETGQRQSLPPTQRFETIWKIGPQQVGTRRLEARYIQRKMRTDPGTTTKRVAIEVTVRP